MANIAAEFGLLAGLCRHPDIYFKIQQHVSVDDFTDKAHKEFFTVLQRFILHAKGTILITKPGLLAEAGSLGLKNFYETCRDGELIEACLEHESATQDVVRAFSQVKTETTKRAYWEFLKKQEKYLKETTEGVAGIVDHIDNGLLNLSNRLQGVVDDDIVHLPSRTRELINELAEHPGELGVPVGLPIWQRSIGGLRNGSVTFVAATAKAGKCVVKDTQIYNPITGYFFSIGDGIKYQNTLSFNGEKLVYSKPVVHVSNGIKQVYKVRTKSGREIRCTDNHPLLTCVGFKELKDLKPNNSIGLPGYYPEPAEAVTIDENIASFLGLMVGDGGCGDFKSFTNEDPGVIDLFENTTKVLGITHKHRLHNQTRCYDIHNNCFPILQEYQLDGKLSDDKDMKFAYGFSNKSLVKTLAAYWDCDGYVRYVNKSSAEISCCTKSKELAYDIRHLLLRWGIQTRIRIRHNKRYNTDYYDLKVITPDSIQTFCSTIGGELSSKKRDICREILQASSSQFKKGFYDLIDSKLLYTYLVDSGIAAKNHFWKRDSVYEPIMRRLARSGRHGVERSVIGPIIEYLPDDIRALITSLDVFYDKIESITPDGEEEVFDIEVEDYHNFVADGLIIHNSQLGARAALEVSKTIPVLYCDSELNETTQQVRVCGMFNEINYEILETGYWKSDPAKIIADGYDKTFAMECQLAKTALESDDNWRQYEQNHKLHYKKMTGMTAREMLPFLRRWVIQNVGTNHDGRVPRCLIIWDYIKLARIDEVQKMGVGAHDVIGDACMALHDFAEEFNLPILAFGQTNRQLDIDINMIAGAKKIVELVDSVSLFRRKDAEDMAISGGKATHEMHNLVSRHGKGISTHVNIRADLGIGKFEELGVAKLQAVKPKSQDDGNKTDKAQDRGDSEAGTQELATDSQTV